VATPKQAEQVLKSEISGFWIGARTSGNPFYVQEIAEVVRGTDIEVWIKNPIHPDLNAWIGAIERLKSASVKKVGAIHRGFFLFRHSDLRNSPVWSIPLGLQKEFAELEIFCDVSHIAGRRNRIAELIRQALYLKFSGIMVEVHQNPLIARTDAEQQVVPTGLASMIYTIQQENISKTSTRSAQMLESERGQWEAVIREEIRRLEKINIDIQGQMDELITNFDIDKE
jgi:chorismate mutase